MSLGPPAPVVAAEAPRRELALSEGGLPTALRPVLEGDFTHSLNSVIKFVVNGLTGIYDWIS